MEIKLNLTDSFDVVRLYQLLVNRKMEYEDDNHNHTDMISLLEGSNTEKAKNRLDYENHCLKINNREVEFINNIIKQIEHFVDAELKI